LLEGGVDLIALDVVLGELEVGGVDDEIVLPSDLDGPDEGVVHLDVVLIEEAVRLADDVEQVLCPFLLELGALRHLADALVNQVLNLAVIAGVQLQQVIDQDD
jgi:hypothetical protein